MAYGIKRTVMLPFEAAVAKVKDELAKEGFGILTEVDVQKVLKQKLHLEHPKYVILGACNPKLGHDALHKDRLMGLFMPCNVIVYDEKGKTVIATQEPTKFAELLENDELNATLTGAETLLRKAIENV
ncbi:MAG TPA: DUF302 domain-containing protein [Candidatus Binatia bacterium]|nr:DUF302 domain-containing protein [Candidatus Binatia bacterium]